MAEKVNNSTRSSICLVVCYFGKLPPYIDCVFRSCAFNPDIEWVIFTDDNTVRQLPPNVRLMSATLGGLQKMFSSKLGFEVNLSHPRLLCHFKAAYGFLFEDIIGEYDFFGHCDLDMIFGDLRKFLSEDILAAYTKILCRGHLTIYRNNQETKRYFMLQAPKTCGYVTDYREAFVSGRTDQLTFDEWRGVCAILRYHNIPQFHDEFIIDILQPTRWKFTRFEGVAIKNQPQQLFYWHNGKIFHAYYNVDRGTTDDEYAYIHFQKRPMPKPSFNPFAVEGFLVTPDGFFPYRREPLTDEDFAKYNQERWRPLGEILKNLCKGIVRRLGVLPPKFTR